VATAVQLRFDAAGAPGLSDYVRGRLIKFAGQRATKEGVIVIEAARFRNAGAEPRRRARQARRAGGEGGRGRRPAAQEDPAFQGRVERG